MSTLVLFLALLAPYYAVRLFRATSLGTRLLLTARRPWSCNTCMAGWSAALELCAAIAALGARASSGSWWLAIVLSWLGLAAITLGLLELNEATTPAPATLPPGVTE